MDEQMKSRLTSGDVWMRALYMVILAIAYFFAEVVLTAVVVFQFLVILFTGSANEPLLRFGQNLTRYIADILRFQTFNTEEKPFPFSDWPDEAPGGERWRGPVSEPAADEPVASEPVASEAPAGEAPAGAPAQDQPAGSTPAGSEEAGKSGS